MTFLKNFGAAILGHPRIHREGDIVRLRGDYPNPESGRWIGYSALFVMLVVIIAAPAFYYGPREPEIKDIGDLMAAIIRGLPAAVAPLLDLVKDWRPGMPLPDLRGWANGLAVLPAMILVTGFAWHIWRFAFDRPFLLVTCDGNTMAVQRGRLGTPKQIDVSGIDAVLVGRRVSGAHEVLLQHSGDLTRLAVVKGEERRALLLKAKLEMMLSGGSGS
ncbi:hypothetical protein [Rhodosalinus sp. 5P4]|uniref:hypothetical protein n=1 Tax=Rhodosalinus sp. 5P4 TaxID=3239196 RepID=UPI00352394D6